MGFSEKSAWVWLIATLVVYVPYFWIVFQDPTASIGLFFAAVVVMSLFVIAFQIVNAITMRSVRRSGNVPPFDELDRKIELTASKLSAIVLAVVVMTWCVVAMSNLIPIGAGEVAQAEPAGEAATSSSYTVPLVVATAGIQALFAGFILASVVYYGSVIVGYRRAAHG